LYILVHASDAQPFYKTITDKDLLSAYKIVDIRRAHIYAIPPSGTNTVNDGSLQH